MSTVGKQPWIEAHEALSNLAARKAESDYEEAHWLLAALRTSVHEHLGLGSFSEYLHRTFGYDGRMAAERLRVARALEELPKTGEALRVGQLCWSVVRELTRVAVPDTEGEWIEAARGRSAHEMEEMVAGRKRGSRPSDKPRPTPRRHRLVLDLSAESYALFREMRSELQRRTGGHLEDDDVIGLCARAVLGGPADEGRASYQVAVTVCECCGAGTVDAAGTVVPIEPVAVEKACCDAQVIDGSNKATQGIPPAIRREVMRRDHGRCIVPGCTNSTWLDVHHLNLLSEGGTHETERMVCACPVHHGAVHDGRLIIDGRFSTGFKFHHADGSPYGTIASPAAAGVSADVFSALKNLGFKECEARTGLAAAREQCGIGEDVSLSDMIVAALRALHKAQAHEESPAYGHPAPTWVAPTWADRSADGALAGWRCAG